MEKILISLLTLWLLCCPITALAAEHRSTSATITISLRIQPDPGQQLAQIRRCATPQLQNQGADGDTCKVAGRNYLAKHEAHTVRMIPI